MGIKVLSLLYEAAERVDRKFPTPDDYPSWVIKQVVERECLLMNTLMNDMHMMETCLGIDVNGEMHI